MTELKGFEEPLGFDAPARRQARRGQEPQDLEGGARGGSRRRSASPGSPMSSSSAAARAASASARGCASSACRPSSWRRTSGPATAGASATSRSACTIRSGTTTCPICRFPKNWPVFSPKDKIGDWLEMYTKVMELNYWGSTDCKSASYDETKKEWTVIVERDGKEIVLQPEATGARDRHVGQAEHARNSRAWRASRATSTIRRSIPARTPSAARRPWSSAPTIRRTTSAPRFGRAGPTSPWCSARRPTSCAPTR